MEKREDDLWFLSRVDVPSIFKNDCPKEAAAGSSRAHAIQIAIVMRVTETNRSTQKNDIAEVVAWATRCKSRNLSMHVLILRNVQP